MAEQDQDALQKVQQAVQDALQAAQDAKQTAQQIAQDTAQAVQDVKQSLETAQAASRGVGAETSSATVVTEATPASIGQAWASNNKRTYDEFLDLSLQAARAAQSQREKLDAAHADLVRELNAEIVRGHRNALSHDEEIKAQVLRHNDLSVDRIWNVDEVSQLVAKTPVFLDAIAAAVAAAVQASK
ncbi:MAG TPA: hypothetical protein VMY42_13555 [Thermoguttaceae bacterium]|nr:hypothetical protein [Thermoguttaceae bacterium]